MMKELGNRETVGITQTPVPSSVSVKSVNIKTIWVQTVQELKSAVILNNNNNNIKTTGLMILLFNSHVL